LNPIHFPIHSLKEKVLITELLKQVSMEKQKIKTEVTPKPAVIESADAKTVHRRSDRTPEPGAAR
jgi:hypothetical protein